MTFWKRQNYRDGGCRRTRGGRNEETENRRPLGGERILYDTVMVDTWHCAFVRPQLYNPVNPNIHYGPKFIIICQYWSISCNKCTTVMWDVNRKTVWGEGVFRNSLGCVFGFVYFFKIFRFSSAVFAKFESINILNPAALNFFILNDF